MVERKRKLPSVTRIPHARILRNSNVKNQEWCDEVFFLAIGVLYEKLCVLQSESKNILYNKKIKCFDKK